MYIYLDNNLLHLLHFKERIFISTNEYYCHFLPKKMYVGVQKPLAIELWQTNWCPVLPAIAEGSSVEQH